jgi:glycosyltransferase involved in cell wall biosynthesis
MAAPLSILQVVANRWWTGSADPALDMTLALRRRGHRVAFACIPGDALEERVRAAGLAPVPGLRLWRTAWPWVLAADLRGLRRVIREAEVDVVHAHQSHDHWLSALAVRGTRARLVRTVHHRRAVHRGPAAGWLFERTDAVLAASAGVAAAIEAAGLRARRLQVVAGAVDAERFRPGLRREALRTDLGLDGAFAVGCLARLVPGRGHDALLQALRLAAPGHPELRLVLIGRGEGRPAIERRIAELGLGSRVILAGYRGPDLPEVLASLDALALLAPGSEESGRAVLEGMAAGLPVVAGRAGALPETVVDGETGWLVEADPPAVAAALARLAADPPRARAMGGAGRLLVERDFTPERRAAAVEAIYAAVLSK